MDQSADGSKRRSTRDNCDAVLIKGRILKICMKETWHGPNPGWMQYDDSVDVDEEGTIVSISGFPINDDFIYRIGSFQDLHIDYGDCPTLAQYYEKNPEGLPDHDAGIGCHVLLLKFYSMGVWRKLLALLDADGDGNVTTDELKALDIDGA